MNLEEYLDLNHNFVDSIQGWEEIQEDLRRSVDVDVYQKYHEIGTKIYSDSKWKKPFWKFIQETGIYEIFQSYEKFDIMTCTEFINKRIRGQKILDLGVGDGVKTVWYALNQSETEFFGVDFETIVLQKAENRKKRFKIKNLEFINADISELPFENETFDTLTACKSLHEFQIDNYGAESSFKITVPEACRVVKKGGIIVGSLPVPNRWAGEEIGCVLGNYFMREKAADYSFKYAQDPSDINNLILFEVKK